MKSEEVLAIQSDDGSPLAGGKREDFGIRPSLIRMASSPNGEDVVAQPGELLGDGRREVLVREETRHNFTQPRFRGSDRQ